MNDLERQLEIHVEGLLRLQDAVTVAEAKVGRYREQRREVIAELLAAGMRPSKVAQLSGLSRQRIHQISNNGKD